MIKLDFTNQTNLKINQSYFQRLIKQYLIKLGKSPNYQLSLSIVSDAEIQKLNQKYLKRNCLTDVLSFSTNFPQIKKAQYLGEIIIAYPYVKKQAAEQGHSLKAELKILTIHGLKHLLTLATYHLTRKT